MEIKKFIHILEVQPKDYNNKLSGIYIPKEIFRQERYCETYVEDGKKRTCWDSGCYCKDNPDSGFIENMCKELKINYEAMGYPINEIYECFDFFLSDSISKKKQEKALNWIEKNTEHKEFLTYTYFDGSNFHSIVLYTDISYEEVDLKIFRKELCKDYIHNRLFVKDINGKEFCLYNTKNLGYFCYKKKEVL